MQSDRHELVHLSQLPVAPERPAAAHKGTFGSVLVIAGSESMSGAARLAGMAALHGGVGLVTVAVPRSILSIVAQTHPAYMVLPLVGDAAIRSEANETVVSQFSRHTSLAMGPGMGTEQGTQEFVRSIYAAAPLPLVLDADGLNAFQMDPSKLRTRTGDAPRILTPHPGEFSRLTGASVTAIQENREELAVAFAREHDVVLLLKGPETVITDGRVVAINRTGNEILAKGGSGDVLTGLIGALLGQGMAALDAARLGAHLHGLAADHLRRKHASPFPTAVELLGGLDEAWQEVLGRPSGR